MIEELQKKSKDRKEQYSLFDDDKNDKVLDHHKPLPTDVIKSLKDATS